VLKYIESVKWFDNLISLRYAYAVLANGVYYLNTHALVVLSSYY